MPINNPSIKYPGLDASEEAEYEQYLATQNNTPNPTAQPNQSNVVYDPTTGFATVDGQQLGTAQHGAGSRRDPRIWGSAGYLFTGEDPSNPSYQSWMEEQLKKNPDYWDIVYDAPRESDGYQAKRINLKADVKERLKGRVQLSQLGTGGYSEVKDPYKVEWDDEFGLVTTPDNIADPDNGPALLQPQNLAMLTAAIIGGGNLWSQFGASAGGAGAFPEITGLGNMALPTGTAAVSPALAGAPALVGGAAGAGGGGLTLAQIASGLRTAGSVVGLGRALGLGGSSSSGSRGGLNLGDLIAGGVTQDRNRRNIGDYRDLLNTLIERGDPYGPERAAAIRRLRDLEANPGSVTSNPLFSSMNDKSQENLSRLFAARGMSVSGNEQGALQENFLANMNQFYKDEWERTAREAGVYIDPGTSVRAGLEGAGSVLRANNNNDAATAALISSLFGGRGNGSGGSIWNTLLDWLGGDNDSTWDWPDGLSSDDLFEDGRS